MEHKNIVATIYIKDGMAVKSPTEIDKKRDVLELASAYDDSGIDKIICYDLSTDDEEHEKNILAIREINRNIQVKTAGGGGRHKVDRTTGQIAPFSDGSIRKSRPLSA